MKGLFVELIECTQGLDDVVDKKILEHEKLRQVCAEQVAEMVTSVIEGYQEALREAVEDKAEMKELLEVCEGIMTGWKGGAGSPSCWPHAVPWSFVASNLLSTPFQIQTSALKETKKALWAVQFRLEYAVAEIAQLNLENKRLLHEKYEAAAQITKARLDMEVSGKNRNGVLLI